MHFATRKQVVTTSYIRLTHILVGRYETGTQVVEERTTSFQFANTRRRIVQLCSCGCSARAHTTGMHSVTLNAPACTTHGRTYCSSTRARQTCGRGGIVCALSVAPLIAFSPTTHTHMSINDNSRSCAIVIDVRSMACRLHATNVCNAFSSMNFADGHVSCDVLSA
jgi:hypothetical protein